MMPRSKKPQVAGLSALCRLVIIATSLHLFSSSLHNNPSQVHCSPQVFSSPRLLNIVNNQPASGQQQQGSSSSSAGPLDRSPRAAAASIEAAGSAGEFNMEDFANNRDEEEATANGRRQAPEMALEPSTGGKHSANGSSKLRIVRLLAPEAVQNGTQNVTLDCMFKFDKNLDQRLTIKWFFNDELEPIYQWIPELNKRVYSDKYERYLDKGYEVSDDVDYMLQSYRWLIAATSGQTARHSPDTGTGAANSIDAALALAAASANTPTSVERHPATILGGPNGGQGEPTTGQQQQEDHDDGDSMSRRLLAGRLAKLAKLGGRHSRQLIESLRSALYMEELEFSRFRALRLILPTSQLNGRFTCSVSSLDGDDLRSTRLVVYEPAKSITFSVNRLPGSQQYNLSCQAGQVFPRPTLTLYRYRAGPLDQSHASESGGNSIPATVSSGAARHGSSSQHSQEAHNLRMRRPKLAATLLKQEVLTGAKTHLSAGSVRSEQRGGKPSAATEPSLATLADSRDFETEGIEDTNYLDINNEIVQQQPTVYEIISWALVDESSLSRNVVTQFECLLTIEGSGYEQRQSLALQRGWHVNSAALTSRHTLVGLFSALASLLCLMLTLVSSMLIFRLLKRHAKNRVHQSQDKKSSSGNSGGGNLEIGTNLTNGSHPNRTTAAQPTNWLSNNTITDMRGIII